MQCGTETSKCIARLAFSALAQFFRASIALCSTLVCVDTLGIILCGEVQTERALAHGPVKLSRPTHVGEGRPRSCSNDCGTPSV